MTAQVRTVPITVEKIMRHRSFERGLDEIRAGEALDTLMDCWFYVLTRS